MSRSEGIFPLPIEYCRKRPLASFCRQVVNTGGLKTLLRTEAGRQWRRLVGIGGLTSIDGLTRNGGLTIIGGPTRNGGLTRNGGD